MTAHVLLQPDLQPRPTGAPLIEARSLTRVWGKGSSAQIGVDGVDLDLYPGEFVAIVGPSGSGKSTLGALISGIDTPTSGSLVIDGQRIDRMKIDALAGWRGGNVGIVFQQFCLLPTLTARENVELALEYAGRRRGRKAAAVAALTSVGLADKVNRLPSQLSGGEQQRVGIARATVTGPRLLVADEPTGALDQTAGHLVFDLLAGLASTGTTVVLITHDLALAAAADRVVHMLDGHIDRVEDLRARNPVDASHMWRAQTAEPRGVRAMKAALRQFRRAPGRIAVSIFALALAIGAVGVLAIPSISEGSLHEAARRDGLADIAVTTSPVTPSTVEALGAVDGVAVAEGQVAAAIDHGDGDTVQIVGLEAGRTMDIVQIERGRLPQVSGEVVLAPDAAMLGDLGDQVSLAGERVTIVGFGSTIWWSGAEVVYTDVATAQAITGVPGLNRFVVTATDDSGENLRAIADATRTELVAAGATFTDAPIYLPDGSTPIDDDIRQISTMIGLLGIVAALVALVLLASTTNTLITERTREVAVMRALGARRRPLRRRLRRIAVGIAAVALLLGLPLGLFIANLIARMVLEKFVGITPTIGWDPVVLAGSAVFALVGARMVAARAARRVTRQPLVNVLRDREGMPFGQRLSERSVGRLRIGGLATRMATRSSVHRRARATGMVLQLAVGVGALVTCAGLVSSVNAYNTRSLEPWKWASETTAANPGLGIEQAAVAEMAGAEAGIHAYAETGDWEIEVYGLAPATEMFATTVADGRWLGSAAGQEREVMVSDGFARQVGIEVGDRVELELASGPAAYSVVGLVNDGWPSVYVDRETLASDLGTPGGANVVWSDRDTFAAELGVPTDTLTAAEVAAADKAGRDAIVAIFGALGAIVVGVALLSVASTTAVNLYERRHELAALQAIGARRRALRGLVLRELGPLALGGAALGVVGGWFGTVGIIGSFEASEAVDIGTRFPLAALPFIVGASAVGVVLLGRIAVRSIGRRSIVTALRSAA